MFTTQGNSDSQSIDTVITPPDRLGSTLPYNHEQERSSHIAGIGTLTAPKPAADALGKINYGYLLHLRTAIKNSKSRAEIDVVKNKIRKANGEKAADDENKVDEGNLDELLEEFEKLETSKKKPESTVQG
jgi:hypothetical protein